MADSNAEVQSSLPGRGTETNVAPVRSARSIHGYTLDGNCSDRATMVCDLRIGMLCAACAMPYDTAGAKAISSASALMRPANNFLTASLELKKSAAAMVHGWVLRRSPRSPAASEALGNGDRYAQFKKATSSGMSKR